LLIAKAKAAELTEMLFAVLTRVGPTNQVLDGGPDPQVKGQFEGMTSGLSPKAVDKHSSWLAAEAIECYINFSQ